MKDCWFTQEQIADARDEILHGKPFGSFKFTEEEIERFRAFRAQRIPAFDKYCRLTLLQFCEELDKRDDDIRYLERRHVRYAGIIIFLGLLVLYLVSQSVKG